MVANHAFVCVGCAWLGVVPQEQGIISLTWLSTYAHLVEWQSTYAHLVEWQVLGMQFAPEWLCGRLVGRPHDKAGANKATSA